MRLLRRCLPPVAALLAVAASALAPSLAAPAAAVGGTPPGPRAPVPASGGGAPPGRTADLRYGPILVPAATGEQPGVFNAVVPVMPMPCTNCFLTGTDVDLVFEDGSSANLDNGLMLHHIVTFNTGRSDATCGPDTAIGSLGERFWAAGNERTGGRFPAGFGYHYGTERVAGVVEIMNHSPQPRVVYVSTKVTHVPDTSAGMPDSSIRPVRPVWLDEDNCADSAYPVAAGPSNKVWRWTSTLTGRVILAGGHVHNGGIKVVFGNETTGEHLCTSYAGYGTNPAFQGSVESMSTCIWDRLGTVRAGEVLSIDTYYDPPEAQPDVMGIVLAYVYETDDLTGGTPPQPGVQAPAPAWPPPGGVPSGHSHEHHHP
jgi:stress up-regulated protein Nod 19